MPTASFEEGIASIVIAGVSMLAAICFNEEPRFRTSEVGDIPPNHKLPAKTPAQLALTENPPERPFGIRAFRRSALAGSLACCRRAY
jgi:hypothetical protein